MSIAQTRISMASRPRSAAFTLIEVLMSVLVLAVGLLGLAAVLPAVLKQQWSAADAVQGRNAAASARAFVESKPTLAAVDTGGPTATYTPVPMDDRFFAIWAVPEIDPDTGKEWRTLPTPGFPGGTPATVTVAGNRIPADALWTPVGMDGTGLNYTLMGLRVQANIDPSALAAAFQQRPAFIPLSERLYPHDSSSMRGPLFVWDLAVRRKAAVSTQGPPPNFQQPPGYDKLQLAVFVRRVDYKIGDLIPRTMTTFQNLTDPSLDLPDRRHPVSVDANGNPTYDGRSDNGHSYSRPVTIPATFTAGVDPFTLQDVRDIISVVPTTPEQAQQVSQPGQMLVDNFGNVYTVIGPSDGLAGIPGVKVTPPVPYGVVSNGPATAPRMRQVLFTPQIPAAVHVFEVNP